MDSIGKEKVNYFYWKRLCLYSYGYGLFCLTGDFKCKACGWIKALKRSFRLCLVDIFEYWKIDHNAGRVFVSWTGFSSRRPRA